MNQENNETEKTIFQKIIDRQISADIIYEDEVYIAILDIYPRSRGHTLLIVKHPYRWVNDVPFFGQYWEMARTIGLRLQSALGAKYITYQTFGMDVPHCHIHIVPRYSLDTGEMTERYHPDRTEYEQVMTLFAQE
jgi:histidine triad (HIT) family protein